MADEQEEEQQQNQNDRQTDESVTDALVNDEKGGLAGMMKFVVPALVVILSAGGGFLVSQMNFGSDTSSSAKGGQGEPPPPTQTDENYSYYDLEPITVNLNEPRLTRHISATLTLVVNKEDYDKVAQAVEKKMPQLKSCLIVYLSDRTLEEVRGAENLNRILREIQDSLNNRLWPRGRGLIQRVDYKQWVVQ